MFILALASAMFMVGCTKDDDDPYTIKNYPTDVATEIKDIYFKQYCLSRFDNDRDGKISKEEALNVQEISSMPYEISTLEGIQYFANLEKLSCIAGNITSVDLRYNRKLINVYFDSCLGLKTVALNDNISVISFRRCKSITDLTIPESITRIIDYAFENCTGLKSAKVAYIGMRAFSNCTSLESVYCKRTTPPEVSTSGIFLCCDHLSNIYVPKESVNAYKSLDGWRSHAAKITGYNF